MLEIAAKAFAKEFVAESVEGIEETGSNVLEPEIDNIKVKSLASLMENNLTEEETATSNDETAEGTSEDDKVGLSKEEKAAIIKETGWSEEIVDAIENMEQYEIYKKADLHEVEINGRKCLVKDIDMDYIDPKTGLSNRELLEKGRAPIDAKTGERIELHHMGQDFDGPLAELCENSEHGDGNNDTLHGKKTESWRQDSEKKNQYNNVQRPNHWKTRAKEA